MTRIFLTKIVFALIFLSPTIVMAQSTSFSLNQSPQNPSPGGSVTFSVSASEFNINLAQIVWSVDDKVKDSGVGKTSFTTTAVGNGKSMIVGVKVTPQNGSTTERTTKISPSEVDLIWESLDGYTPAFYRGKTLPISQSIVKIVAIPNVKTSTGTNLTPDKFSFIWRRDSQNLPGSSGYGKSSLIFSNQILNKTNIVEVSATDGINKVSDSMIISYFEPEILFYEEGQTSGILYSKAILPGLVISQPRLTVIAEPYFLPGNLLTDQNIKTIWKLNGQQVEPQAKNKLIINTSATSGQVNVNFNYNDTKKLFRNFSNVVNFNIK